MAGSSEDGPPVRKKARMAAVGTETTNSRSLTTRARAPISPPRQRNKVVDEFPKSSETQNSALSAVATPVIATSSVLPSPFQLTWIRDLPDELNKDAVTLRDILGDPLISECWEFNYLHDIDFLMEAFDEDVRSLVKVHVVHGHWRHEDPSAAMIKVQAANYQNVTPHTAFMPEAYGTHHTKMMILLRHDDTAQIIIHTANLIRQDWTNLTQAVWRSPILPRKLGNLPDEAAASAALGSGEKFKIDFLNYLRSYDTKRIICKPIIDKLLQYDFADIRGVLIGSVPGRHSIETDNTTLWGWPAVKNALSRIPSIDKGTTICQISSIATLGVNDTWLSRTLFNAFSASSNKAKPASHRIIFPTPDEIRHSLDGYNSGASIHLKIHSQQHQKQLLYLKPLLHHWAGDDFAEHKEAKPAQEAGRRRAAPHIKTYLRFDEEMKRLSWALVTSANISKQAWGDGLNSAGDVRIQSYELGVLLWPGLWGEETVMVPTFGTDMPEITKTSSAASSAPINGMNHTIKTIGFRMPYDLPLTKYGPEEKPWCATASYEEPDWKGQTY